MNTFVLVACGPQHALRASIAIQALKLHTRNDIVLVAARAGDTVKHDQVIYFNEYDELSDVELSRFLKTGVNKVLGRLAGNYCYLDSDVLAVSPEASDVFNYKHGPITFAPDHQSNLWKHARTVLKKPVPQRGSLELWTALMKRFGVEIDPFWNLWNGGVFVFNDEASEFLDTWHKWTCALFGDPELKTRDQGALAAVVWKFGMQSQATLPEEFNWIVGCTRGYVGPLFPKRSPLFLKPNAPKLLHFIGRKIHRPEYKYRVLPRLERF